MNHPPGFFTGLSKRIQKNFTRKRSDRLFANANSEFYERFILVIEKNWFLSISTTHHMVDRPREFNTWFPCHAKRNTSPTAPVNYTIHGPTLMPSVSPFFYAPFRLSPKGGADFFLDGITG